LLLSINPTLTPYEKKNIIMTSGDTITISTPIGPQEVQRLNAYNAVNSVSALHITPFSHNFGSIEIDHSSAIQTFTLTNTDETALTINSITRTGLDPDEFSHIASGLPWTLPAGGTETFTVIFTPTSPGNKSTILNISHSGSSIPRFISLSGFGMPEPATLPYSHDFEDINENNSWILLNGGLANKWHIGTAVAHTGTRSLYISANNGVSNNVVLSTSFVYALRTIDFTEPGSHTVSFNWRCQGDQFWHNVRAFFVPIEIQLMAGNSYGNHDYFNEVPPGWIAISDILNGQTTWQTFINNDVVIPSAGLYNLVFFWKNDDHGSTSFIPAAIDNISVFKTTPQPEFAINLTSYDFGEEIVSQSSTAQIFTITNTGSADLIVDAVFLNYELNPPFPPLQRGVMWVAV